MTASRCRAKSGSAAGLIPKGTKNVKVAKEFITYFTQPQVDNPASDDVNSEEVWPEAEADIVRNGMTPQAAVDKAIKRVEAIFAKYPIAQS